MPLITLHNKYGIPRVLDTADFVKFFPSRFGSYTRVILKHELIDVQEDAATIARRIKEAEAGGKGA